mmetsp:Transcript_72595/g.100654  ORF Transcript_72595/g.100654 Transcript_72595/m.100654 type:complete len:90 (-) Transcript_72595:780-1049(-)
MIAISYLTFTQLAKHQELIVKKDTFVSSDASRSQFVDMNLDLIFPNAPCFMIDFDIANGFHQYNWDTLANDLTRTRIDSKTIKPVGKEL